MEMPTWHRIFDIVLTLLKFLPIIVILWPMSKTHFIVIALAQNCLISGI